MIKYIQFLALVILFLGSCTPKMNVGYERTGRVKCIKHDRMTITLSSEGQAESVGKAVNFAERNAIENLLFKGIPASNQEKPLIDNESVAKNKNAAFFDEFIMNRGYQQYITESLIADDYQNGSYHLITQNITVDLTNLRDFLVKEGIIKKFGLY